MKKIILLVLCMFAILPVTVNATYTDVPEELWVADRFAEHIKAKGILRISEADTLNADAVGI